MDEFVDGAEDLGVVLVQEPEEVEFSEGLDAVGQVDDPSVDDFVQRHLHFGEDLEFGGQDPEALLLDGVET